MATSVVDMGTARRGTKRGRTAAHASSPSRVAAEAAPCSYRLLYFTLATPRLAVSCESAAVAEVVPAAVRAPDRRVLALLPVAVLERAAASSERHVAVAAGQVVDSVDVPWRVRVLLLCFERVRGHGVGPVWLVVAGGRGLALRAGAGWHPAWPDGTSAWRHRHSPGRPCRRRRRASPSDGPYRVP
jgi:hypothetical protein